MSNSFHNNPLFPKAFPCPIVQEEYFVTRFVEPCRKIAVVLFVFGKILSNMDLIFRANISSAGDKLALVFGLGVILYTDRKFSRLFSSVSMPWFFFKALLNVSSNLSVRPFDLGWYIAVVKCSMDRALQNSSNSLLVNWVLLLLTIVLGTPKRLKRSLSASIVLVDVGCLHLNTSGYFVKLSTTTKK